MLKRKLYLTLLYGSIVWCAAWTIVFFLNATTTNNGPGDAVTTIFAILFTAGPLALVLGAKAWVDWDPS